MARRRAAPPADDMPTAPFWMATFSDMVTLLLAFFVMLVAMSSVETEKFDEALSFFPGRTGIFRNERGLIPNSVPQQPPSEVAQAERYDELLEQLAQSGLDAAVEVSLSDDGVLVTLVDTMTFTSGTAELVPTAERVLATLAGVLDADVQRVVVEGHTDAEPIGTSVFPSNWELSTARAGSVVRSLLTHNHDVPADRFQAVGYAEHRPRASNATASGRALNRRVHILISNEPWPKPNRSLPPTP